MQLLEASQAKKQLLKIIHFVMATNFVLGTLE